MKKNNNNKEEIIQGRWWKIKNNIQESIQAKYDRIKDWKMDPNGYFLILVDKKKKIIDVGFCKFSKLGNSPFNEMVAIVSGKKAITIVNTLIKKNFISSLQHAADMGIELHKAELSLKYGFKYIQDKDLFV